MSDNEFLSPTPAEERRLTQKNYIAVARLLKCEVAAIQAVASVESSGDGFLDDGRPKILFERHKFHKFTNGQFDSYWDVSSKKPGGYHGGAEEYERLAVAMGLDREAALKATSWGKFQIMGFNHSWCGHSTVELFAQAMALNEWEQLKAFGRFIESAGLKKHLQARNWAKFARGYNGPAYARNRYDAKMATAYNGLVHADGIEHTRKLQIALRGLGHDPGPIDGVMGPSTRAALMRLLG